MWKQRLRRFAEVVFVLVAAFAATTAVQAAWDSAHCRGGAQAQPLPPHGPVSCRLIRFMSLDSLQGTAVIAIGPPATGDSSGVNVPNYPYGIACSGAPE